ncbi:MAG: hypothetical protein OHK0011_09620 [Turneriella sp.]
MRYTMSANFKLRQSFAAHVDEVLAARERRFDDVSKQESLKKQELLERRHEGDFIVSRRAFSLADRIPDALKSMIPAGFLNLVETAKFDTKNRVNRFEVIYEQNPDRLRISGVTHYVHESDTSSRREYDITVKVNMALVGGILENQIASAFRKGIEKDYEVIKELLAQGK